MNVVFCQKIGNEYRYKKGAQCWLVEETVAVQVCRSCRKRLVTEERGARSRKEGSSVTKVPEVSKTGLTGFIT